MQIIPVRRLQLIGKIVKCSDESTTRTPCLILLQWELNECYRLVQRSCSAAELSVLRISRVKVQATGRLCRETMAQLSTPSVNANVSSTSFGRVVSAMPSRVMQVATKFNF